MKAGDKVRFIGDKSRYLVSFQSTLNRVGEIVPLPWGDRERPGRVHVRWIPKSKKRGVNEYSKHDISELELISEGVK